MICVGADLLGLRCGEALFLPDIVQSSANPVISLLFVSAEIA